MRIEQLMTKVTRTCRSGHSLSEAAQMMWDNDGGCLPVTAGDGSQRLLGIITDRDICMAIRFGAGALTELRVEDAMTEVVRACNPGDPISEALAIMGEACVRRLPVVDESERVIGMLSLADLALEATRQTTWREPKITLAEVGELLATICQPRGREPQLTRCPAGSASNPAGVGPAGLRERLPRFRVRFTWIPGFSSSPYLAKISPGFQGNRWKHLTEAS